MVLAVLNGFFVLAYNCYVRCESKERYCPDCGASKMLFKALPASGFALLQQVAWLLLEQPLGDLLAQVTIFNAVFSVSIGS